MTPKEPLMATLTVNGQQYRYFPVSRIEGAAQLPYSLCVLLENALRCSASEEEARTAAQGIIEAAEAGRTGSELSYRPARVLLQDFTGVPVFVDFAAMREAMRALGGDPAKVNPQIPCDLVIDHSVIADEWGNASALEKNMSLEFMRNHERYTFLKWAQASFKNVRIVPPGTGICHQINVEEFAPVVMAAEYGAADGSAQEPGQLAYFDTVVGTDSHTTTTNGIGVLSWGVGGIEAEAAALGQAITILVPRVVGIRLTGALDECAQAMDVALVFAQLLRAKGVVGSFVECFGPGLAALSATQRACIANMTPEYGCTCTLFPIDGQTIEYLRLTGRSEQQAALVEAYAKAQGFWGDPDAPQRRYAEVIELDLSTIRPSIAGPSRPHDRIEWHEAKAGFGRICADRGLDRGLRMTASFEGEEYGLGHGALALAAITSCTTATDPAMMVACGLLAQNAVNAGLQAKPWVKRVFAPGSHATRLLLERADLEDALCELGFYNCGYGCMSCIGNSGPLLEGMETLAGHLELASVLSGNRNFEGRISPDISQNYLASPAAVVAYSLAGTIDFDFETQLLGKGKEGEDLFLRDIWPSAADVEDVLTRFCDATLYEQARAGLYRGTQAWQDIRVEPSATFAWDEGSTYVRRAPYFDALSARHPESLQIQGARVLAYLGDFVTTDHISPAGSIAQGSPAASYLKDKGVETALYNTYGARRGNHEAMMRGTFANVRLENRLAQGMHGGITYDAVEKRLTSIFEAAESYRGQGIPLVVLAGKMYGSGSSRDWAAKGPALLGVRAVFAESFERIHRSNLIGMGILPLQFEEGQSAASLGFDGSECITIAEIDFTQGLPSPAHVMVRASREDGTILDFSVMVRIDTPTEGRYFAQGGILPYVLRNLAS